MRPALPYRPPPANYPGIPGMVPGCAAAPPFPPPKILSAADIPEMPRIDDDAPEWDRDVWDEADIQCALTEWAQSVTMDSGGKFESEVDDLLRGVGTRYAFHGRYSTTGDCSFESTDPMVYATYYGGVARFSWAGDTNRVSIPREMINVAAGCVASASPYARYLSILSKWTRSDENLERIRQHCDPEELRMTALRAFFLAGVLSSVTGGNGCECESVQIATYRVPDPRDRTVDKHVRFFDNKALFKEKWPRTFRLGYYHIDGLVAHIADATDEGTLKAGIKKRLFPTLPARTREMEREIEKRTGELIEICEAWMAQHPDFWNEEERLEEFLRGRNEHEKKLIAAGYYKARDDDSDDVLKAYIGQVYKCFIKLESYTLFANKPNRFIMTLPPEFRGVQFYYMGKILYVIEQATAEGNVKHLKPEEVLEKLKRKFADVAYAYETDFSSFESCLQPELKNMIENRLFAALATTTKEQEFVKRALIERKKLDVIGPCFKIKAMPHIRMSGDLWTSIGNLVSNVVLNAAIGEVAVGQLLHDGLFEGDDGIFPARIPEDEYNRRAADAGVLLKVKRGRWEELSFCGNNMCDFNGTLLRTRDPVRVVQGLSTIFNADQQTRKYDRMLQRSKAISVLSQAWVPGASVFAAGIEWSTRDVRVDEGYLRSHGLLKEWQPYSLESCLPKDMCTMDKSEFCRVVACRDVAAGGSATEAVIRKMLDTMERSGECPNFLGIQDKTALKYVDGTRFSWAMAFRNKEHLKEVWNDKMDKVFRRGKYAALRHVDNYSRGRAHSYQALWMSTVTSAMVFMVSLMADMSHWRERLVAEVGQMLLYIGLWAHAFMVRSGRMRALWTIGGSGEQWAQFGGVMITNGVRTIAGALWRGVFGRDVPFCSDLGSYECMSINEKLEDYRRAMAWKRRGMNPAVAENPWLLQEHDTRVVDGGHINSPMTDGGLGWRFIASALQAAILSFWG